MTDLFCRSRDSNVCEALYAMCHALFACDFAIGNRLLDLLTGVVKYIAM